MAGSDYRLDKILGRKLTKPDISYTRLSTDRFKFVHKTVVVITLLAYYCELHLIHITSAVSLTNFLDSGSYSLQSTGYLAG